MTPNYHPLAETLMSYASGTLPDALSCVVACHLTLCEDCTDNVRRLEMLGGLMLSRLPGTPCEEAVESTIAPPPPHEPLDEAQASQVPDIDVSLLPLPLVHYLSVNGEKVRWKTFTEGVQQYRIELPKASGQMRLLRLVPGQLLSEQTYAAGTELALVLGGVLSDGVEDYVRGDIIEWSADSPPQLKASGDVECVCLIGSDVKPASFAQPYVLLRELRWKVFPPELRFQDIWDRKAALAASITMIAGLAFGWLFWAPSENSAIAANDLVQIVGNRLIAKKTLRNVLETLPSGEERAFAFPNNGELQLSIKMTFQDQAGNYCRQYQVTSLSPDRYSGIACRMDQEWIVKIQALVPPSRSSEAIVPAGEEAEAAIDAVVAAQIYSNPLVGDEEAAIMNNGWKK